MLRHGGALHWAAAILDAERGDEPLGAAFKFQAFTELPFPAWFARVVRIDVGTNRDVVTAWLVRLEEVARPFEIEPA